jgi:hypothetical protein
VPENVPLSVAEFVQKYGIDKEAVEVLSKMRFRPGERLDEEVAQGLDWHGLQPLVRLRILKFNREYRRSLKQ